MKKVKVDRVKLQLVRESSNFFAIERAIESPLAAYKAIKEMTDIENENRETVVLVTLDTKGKVTTCQILFTGGLNICVLDHREIFKIALLSNSNSILVAHNHPSGDPTPSTEDRKTHDRMEKAAKIMGIHLLDKFNNRGKLFLLFCRTKHNRNLILGVENLHPLN